MKKVLVISSSPRKGGNSDILCDDFIRGAEEAGNEVEKIFLADYKINYCTGCDICSSKDVPCRQDDDALSIIEKMIKADVIVFGTPVYFYNICAQLKTLIDRTCGVYKKIKDKEFYYLATAAEENPDIMEYVVSSMKGFLDCLDNPALKGTVLGAGVWHKGEIKDKAVRERSYLMGKGL